MGSLPVVTYVMGFLLSPLRGSTHCLNMNREQYSLSLAHVAGLTGWNSSNGRRAIAALSVFLELV